MFLAHGPGPAVCKVCGVNFMSVVLGVSADGIAELLRCLVIWCAALLLYLAVYMHYALVPRRNSLSFFEGIAGAMGKTAFIPFTGPLKVPPPQILETATGFLISQYSLVL